MFSRRVLTSSSSLATLPRRSSGVPAFSSVSRASVASVPSAASSSTQRVNAVSKQNLTHSSRVNRVLSSSVMMPSRNYSGLAVPLKSQVESKEQSSSQLSRKLALACTLAAGLAFLTSESRAEGEPSVDSVTARLLSFDAQKGKNSPEVEKLFMASFQKFQEGNVSAGTTLFREAIQQSKKTYGDGSATIKLLCVGGMVIGGLFRNKDLGLELVKEADAIVKKKFGDDHGLNAVVQTFYALITDTAGDKQATAEHKKRCLEVCNKAFGPNHPDTHAFVEFFDELEKSSLHK